LATVISTAPLLSTLFCLQLLSSDVSSNQNSDPVLVNTLKVSLVLYL